MKTASIFAFFLLLFPFGNAQAQCDLSPAISGDIILCPDENGTLTTQATFDSYQWFRREWGATEAEPIAGATSSSLLVGPNDVLTSFSVEVTQDTCTATSPEVLLDGWVFLLPTVQTTGNYEYNPNTGTFDLCSGDTIWMNLNQPYTTSITWFRDGQPIPGENSASLVVTEQGAYTVQGAPEVCPNFILGLGLELAVSIIDCTTGVAPEPWADRLQIFPNPTHDRLQVHLPLEVGTATCALVDARGQLVRSEKVTGQWLEIEMADLPAGGYFLQIQTDAGTAVRKVLKN